MPRLQLQGALSSADQTQLEGVLDIALAVEAAALGDDRDLAGDLTTGIALAGSLAVTLTLAATFTSADPQGTLPMSLTLNGALSTSIALSASATPALSLTLRGVLAQVPSGTWAPEGGPGDLWRNAVTASLNGTAPSASRTSTIPTMEEP